MSPAIAPITALHNEKREAERLGFSQRTLQMWRLRGGGPPFIKIHSSVRYDPAQVDAWLAGQVRSHTAGGAA